MFQPFEDQDIDTGARPQSESDVKIAHFRREHCLGCRTSRLAPKKRMKGLSGSKELRPSPHCVGVSGIFNANRWRTAPFPVRFKK